ncbi:Senescence regulator S40 [Macleaya cordata]|uniref:Senescence regulator S40 n=1 Tax=Macleaya cordata TaxID=56857 RepID=A0A200QJC6_MACCD|nr:Senescence regulator S40 [Macleaya cordata]
MAKGRKIGSGRNERLLGSFGYNQGQGGTGIDGSELGEEDVWSMVDGDHDHMVHGATSEWPSINGGRQIGSRQWISRDGRQVAAGGLSLALKDSSGNSNRSQSTATSRMVHQVQAAQENMGTRMAASAPVNVPDWQKILRVDSVESFHDSDDGLDEHDLDKIPPHEYLARGYARSRKMNVTSVFEGVGRTLKGRDMSRVRDAVWSQTGFDG